MTNILDHLSQRVLLCDGGTGALVQAMNLSVEKDFQGLENCTEILVKSRPDVIRSIHERYYEAGADMVEADTFGASPITLAPASWYSASLAFIASPAPDWTVTSKPSFFNLRIVCGVAATRFSPHPFEAPPR